jgi:hypothetical protein
VKRHLFNLLAAISLVTTSSAIGCFSGQGPSASRIRTDTNDRYYPQREIHFVEHGQRSTGVLVSATPGFTNAFSATWVTMLVPIPPPRVAGPAWTSRNATRAQAQAIADLPDYRNGFYLGMYGNSVRFRFRELSVWILSTDPLIIGLPAGEPKHSWREFATLATGQGDEQFMPVDSLVARLVVDEELDQPLARLIVFPQDFWKHHQTTGQSGGPSLSVLRLPNPQSINDILEALTRSEPTQLGSVENVAYYEQFDSDKAHAREILADRERLLGH